VRWSNLTVEAESGRRLPGYREPAVVRTFDAPEALDTRFYEVHCRSALNRVPKRSRMPFPWTINPYRGCTHACTYCFARPTHTYLDMDAGRDFEREIVVKVNLPEVLRVELARPSWKREHVALGTNTDPYQWVESRYRLMPEVWRALRDSGTPCSVLTKSPLLLRDIGLFEELAARGGFTANLSIPTLDEKAWRATEPHTPHPRKRIEAVAELNRAGVPTGVLVAPLMPGINDAPEQVEPILEACAAAGATHIGGIALHLRGEVREIFFDWLRSHRPELVPRYEELYRRGAYAAPAEQERLARLIRGARPSEAASGRLTPVEGRDVASDGSRRGEGTIEGRDGASDGSRRGEGTLDRDPAPPADGAGSRGVRGSAGTRPARPLGSGPPLQGSLF
jgi:DNA repair photolyase